MSYINSIAVFYRFVLLYDHLGGHTEKIFSKDNIVQDRDGLTDRIKRGRIVEDGTILS